MGESGKNKGGRPRVINKLTAEELDRIQRLAAVGTTVEDIAYIFRCSKKTLERRLKEALGGFDALRMGRILAQAEVKMTAYKMAVSGQYPEMTKFYCKTQCGWTEKAPPSQETLMTVSIQNNHASLLPQSKNSKLQTAAFIREALGLPPKAKAAEDFTGGQDVD